MDDILHHRKTAWCVLRCYDLQQTDPYLLSDELPSDTKLDVVLFRHSLKDNGQQDIFCCDLKRISVDYYFYLPCCEH
jgi:hypothetical protein